MRTSAAIPSFSARRLEYGAAEERLEYGAAEERLKIAADIDRALQSIGFFFIDDHGIDQAMVNECFKWVSSPGDRSSALTCH